MPKSIRLHQMLWLLLAIAFIAGLIARFFWFQNRGALWADEAAIAFNVMVHPLTSLASPLLLDQVAPVGWIGLLKILVLTAGDTEYTYRVFSLIIGILCIPALFLTARRLVDLPTALIATSLFCLAGPAIYYSGEAKPYICDALAATLLLLAAVRWRETRSLGWLLALGLGGALAIWFSLSAVFILAGLAATLGIDALVKRDRRQLVRLAPAVALWVACGVLQYRLALRPASSSSYLTSFWTSGFLPFPPRSAEDFRWFVGTPLHFFEHPAGLATSNAESAAVRAIGWMTRCVAAVCCLAGCVALIRKSPFNGWLIVSFLPPLAMASALHKYPAIGRTVMFGVPLMLIPLAYGVGQLLSARRVTARWSGTALLLCFLIWPACQTFAAINTPKPTSTDYLSSILSPLAGQRQPGDQLFVRETGCTMYSYYALKYGCYIPPIVGPRGDEPFDPATLDPLRGNPRVWVLISNSDPSAASGDFKRILPYFQKMGTCDFLVESEPFALFRFNLSAAANATSSE